MTSPLTSTQTTSALGRWTVRSVRPAASSRVLIRSDGNLKKRQGSENLVGNILGNGNSGVLNGGAPSLFGASSTFATMF